tara:strand:+ start:294 stop:641 length:348 start_codon:yes stop_codon:yes gene_type:complete
MQKEKITIVGSGYVGMSLSVLLAQHNDVTVLDINSGLIIVGKNGFGDNYGIGNPQSYSVIQIAKIFGGKIKMLPERQGNRMSAQVHAEKTIELGWKPKYEIIDYVDQIRRNNWEL